MERIDDIFGKMVFNDKVMKERLPEDVYLKLQETVSTGYELDKETANIIADAMKDWAIENGATHFTHWFQPMTGITAEKHDSFVEPSKGGGCILKFSGKSLVKGESDASSFPSGGLRATFEARGYTAWDPSSYAFLKDGSLCIPTVFCSYDGSTLDKKTPLLRSNQAINKQALRILKLFGNTDAKKVFVSVGAEQEYFLIDKNVAEKRLDLMITGRTLFGARPPKGQELDDHYYGSIKPRVSEFMKDLDRELWLHGIPSKTKHNEVAPAQHELAPTYGEVNTATDHNQLTMDIMKLVAKRHDMVCLLHEKPFESVNGSGKHNNWSLTTDTGINLLEPGKTPFENAQFLLFLTAVISAVDDNQELLRACVASCGNDHRLGANEAPPAIVSIFLGDELTNILHAIEEGENYSGSKKQILEIGVNCLPKFSKDNTDRNRTSPLAFTGNKFEFRMVGSSLSIAGPNIVLNTAVADKLKEFADELENADDFKTALNELIKRNVKQHKRILFNGNNYSEEWVREAAARKLSNLKTTVDAIPNLISEKSVRLFGEHGVFSKQELFSRCDILLENYYKSINIEAMTMVDMATKLIIPACFKYEKELADLIYKKENCATGISSKAEEKRLKVIAVYVDKLYDSVEKLQKDLKANDKHCEIYETAKYFKDTILTDMETVRTYSDNLEAIVSKEYWPIPSYSDLLYSIK
ncbi:MAG: glutamine synthetase III [Christensenellaceae bacterium]